VTIENAIIGIFDINRLLANLSAWKKPFLICYADLIKRSSVERTYEAEIKLRKVLHEAALAMQIELVHYFTENCDFFYGGGRMYRKDGY
jgi:hypothetical protein